MEDILYEVRITALLPGPESLLQVYAAFADLFCLPPAEARQRLSTLPLVVRGDLSLEQAGKYQRVLSRAGMACEIQAQSRPQAEPPSWSAPPAVTAPAGGQA